MYKKFFKFEKMWTEDLSCSDVIKQAYEIRGSNDNVDNFTLKVAYVLMICRDGTKSILFMSILRYIVLRLN